MNFRKVSSTIIYITLLFIAFLLISLFFSFENKYFKTVLDKEKVYEISENVDMVDFTGNSLKSNLPLVRKFPAKNKENNTFRIKFNKDFSKLEDKVYLKVFSCYLYYKIICENDVIYDSSLEYVGNEFYEFSPSSLNLIYIPNTYSNKDITIEFKSALSWDYKIRIPEIILTSVNTHYRLIYANDMSYILFFTFISIVSLMIGIFGIVSRWLGIKNNLVIICIFTFLLSLYTIALRPVFYLNVRSDSFIYLFEYTLFYALPIPILHVICTNYEVWKQKTFNVVKYILIINVVLQLILNLLHITTYIYMRNFTVTVMVIMLILLLLITAWSAYLSYRKKLNFSYKIVFALLVFVGCLFSYVIFRSDSFTMVSLIALVLYLFDAFIITFKEYIVKYKSLVNKDFYISMSYIDSLTSINNRTAFDEDLKKTTYNIGKNLTVFCVDINMLKYVNDNFGHNAGDVIIAEVGRILKSLSEMFKNTKAYRLGGDEFVVLSYNLNMKNIKSMIEYINLATTNFKYKDTPIKLSVAIGVESSVIDENFDFDEVLKSADKKMYDDKTEKKSTLSF